MCISIRACVRGFGVYQCWVTYREDEAVLEVRELFVTLLASEHAILLVHHLFVAVLAWAGLIKAIFLAQINYGCYGSVVVCLKKKSNSQMHEKKDSVPNNITKLCFSLDDLCVVYAKYVDCENTKNSMVLTSKWHFQEYVATFQRLIEQHLGSRCTSYTRRILIDDTNAN